MKRLRKSDIKELSQRLGYDIDKKSDVLSGDQAILVDGLFSFFRVDDKWVPALPLLLQEPGLLPRVTVDMGAVRHIVNGADVMRPGITAFESAKEGDFVVVVDETHGKPLLVGKMLFDSETAKGQDSGKTVASLHYVGDDLWKEHV